ncbi:Isoaspartyl aminopeptidase [Enhygromyxa salina]|uniref:Isoaspartyl peptidase n=1 Tax=Enhygromyxa salina TaxID=215803 RepID=A0A0C2CUJ2_9BACT|nr:isoaspartyl peptidase/L-asparaginase [Enhygromyxa salina]KIG14791.1 Isoaspartyl aminopeptidase [Enhygromyxa salina]
MNRSTKASASGREALARAENSRGLVLVHGGAGTNAFELQEAAVAGTRRAAALGLARLVELGDSEDACVEAVIAAVRSLEDDPAFNAGRGACMTALGEFEVDAGIMRSRDRQTGAVASVRELANACELARAVMERSDHALLVGDGAQRFGEACGVGRFGRELLWTDKAQQRFEQARSGQTPIDNRADTVGAIAMDRRGHLCALGSTGGVLFKLPGRVGDTPLIGAGFYADATLGAALGTGVGEAIMGRVGCYELLRRAASGVGVQAAAEQLCQEIHRDTGAAVGFIAVGRDGTVGMAHCSAHMSWALAREGHEITGALTVDP